MKPKNLLLQLAELEEALANFSFEELTSSDAQRLKSSFDKFRGQLERKLWGSENSEIADNTDTAEQETTELKENREETLIATVSHEIRTPLSGIVGFADLLKESELTAEQAEQVSAIRSASHNLMDIINELLEYSKLAAGLEHFENIDFNFNSIIRDVSYLCQTLITGKEIKLIVDQDPQIPEILQGDPSKLSQVLLNLLGNSIKFVDTGKIFLNISLIKEKKDQVWLEFVITDTGIGISDEDLKHIFDSFKQANQHIFSKYGGTGLGLNIVKQIVEKLNGELEVSSRLGVGTTFRFILAYQKGSTGSKAGTKTKKALPENLKGMKVLVFEDNLLNQRLIEQRLKAWGCQTYVTENALYGLNLIENTKIDMVLMDLRMPIMNGFEATRRIRSSDNSKVKNVPIIALTADFTADDKDECTLNGINDYILKPFSPSELLSKMLEHKDALKQNMAKAQLRMIDSESGNQDPTNIDLKPALEDCMGDLSVLLELIQLYKQNALEFMGKLKVSLENEDFGQIKDAAHKIKCGLAMMNTHSLYFIVEQIHSNCSSIRDINHLRKLYECFIKQYPTVEKTMDAEFEKLKIKGLSKDDQ